MSHVSEETAIKLKSAGFPQPAPTQGQFWYKPNYFLYLCRWSRWNREPRFTSIGTSGPLFSTLNDDERVFAPFATDILEWASYLANRGSTGAIVRLTPPGMDHPHKWRATIVDRRHDALFDNYHDNPAEAMAESALAWIARQNPVLPANP